MRRAAACWLSSAFSPTGKATHLASHHSSAPRAHLPPPQPEEGRPGALSGIFRAGLVYPDTFGTASQIISGIMHVNGFFMSIEPGVNLLREPGAGLLAFPWLRAVVRVARTAPRGAWEEALSLEKIASFVAAVAHVPGAVRITCSVTLRRRSASVRDGLFRCLPGVSGVHRFFERAEQRRSLSRFCCAPLYEPQWIPLRRLKGLAGGRRSRPRAAGAKWRAGEKPVGGGAGGHPVND